MKRKFKPASARLDYDKELNQMLEENGISILIPSQANPWNSEQMFFTPRKYMFEIDIELVEYKPSNERYYTMKEKEEVIKSLQEGYTGELDLKYWKGKHADDKLRYLGNDL